MKNETKKILLLALLLGLAGVASAQITPDNLPGAEAASAVEPLLDGLAGKYGWVTTVILCIGSLRILCKPLMLALENALQSDPEKLARLQKFEAGPVYKTLAFILDLGASIKLPLVKPPGK
ncbi:MAG TPA: hypothetical protein VMZ27_15900 [Candidatus Saccharimonadales bacterium]|nr:hypothetical protein [Candidatus Saccharimonadales bacterium]